MVGSDEDDLCVRMQLVDGILDTLITAAITFWTR